MASLSRPTDVRLLAAAIVVALLAACDPVAPPSPDAAAAVTSPPGPVGPVERARVVRVVDGDTIVVSIDGRDDRVRYIGVDAPESVRPGTPVEPFAREASRANSELVAGRLVLLERDVSERDEFGRLLRYVWLETPDGNLLVNFELVVRGFATAVTFPPDVRHVDLLRAAETDARSRARGLWSPGAPTGPQPRGD